MPPISAGEIVTIVVLFAALAIAIWWFTISYQYRKTLTAFSYTKGANLDTATVGQGNTGVGAVSMTCDQDRELCVWEATAICTGTNGQTNHEDGFEPISNGSTSPYGNFDPTTTANLTPALSTAANGKQSYVYNFNGNSLTFGNKGNCPLTYNIKDGSGTRPQLIATYTCIPKGTPCISSTTKKR